MTDARRPAGRTLPADQWAGGPGRPARDRGYGPGGDGWFPDPLGEDDERYWDGVGWTGYVQAVLPRRLKNVHYRIAIGACIVWGIANIAELAYIADGIDAVEAGKPEPSPGVGLAIVLLVYVMAATVAIVEFIVGFSTRRAQRQRAQRWNGSTAAPPGWYRDPEFPEQASYWDGQDWVRSVRQ